MQSPHGNFGYEYSQRRASLRAITKKRTPATSSTETCCQRCATGSSRQKTLVKPSIAHALMVSSPAFCIASGMRKRGNMLPPTEDMIRITNVDSGPSCARVRHVLAKSIPNAATAKAVHSPIMTQPANCGVKSSLKTSQAQTHMNTSCENANREHNQ